MRGSFIMGAKVLVFASLCLPLATGCVKKGKGKGSRDIRPDSNSTIFDDGDKNQKPEEEEETKQEEMNPEAKAILAACFKLDVSEVQDIVGWTDPVASVNAAKELCAKIEKTGYANGIAATAEPVEID